MISYITGTLAEIEDKYIVVEAGGVGYGISVTSRLIGALPAMGSSVKIYTHLQVSEDAQKLFGFGSAEERTIFRQLLSVSGVGPKAAMGVLSVMSPDELRLAVLSGDAKVISRAPGLGKKTAEKIIVELKDKYSINDLTGSGAAAPGVAAAAPGAREDAVAALVAMGFSASQALSAISSLGDISGKDAGELLSLALKALAR